MTGREINLTHAWRIVTGAQLYGGVHDGRTVAEAMVSMPVDGIADVGATVMLLLEGGRTVHYRPHEFVAWLPPVGSPNR